MAGGGISGADDAGGDARADAALPPLASAEAVKLWLSERFARETDPARLLHDAAAAVGTFLHVARVGYGEFAPDLRRVTVPLDWCRPGVASIAGSHAFDGESPITRELGTGRTLVIGDIAEYGGEGAIGPMGPVASRAFIVVPLINDGRLVAAFVAADDRPRAWSEAEVGLVNQTGARIWGALQHLRLTEQLRTNEEQFRMMAENMPGICWVGDRDAKPLWGNSRWHAMYDDTAAAHGDARDVIHPDDFPRARQVWREMREQGIAGAYPLRLRDRDGLYRPFLSQASPMRDATGAVTRWVGVQIDLSAQQAQDRRQGLLRAFGDRARDLRDPAAILLLLAGMLRDQLDVELFIYADAPDGDMLAGRLFRALDGKVRTDEVPGLAAAFGEFAKADRPTATFIVNTNAEMPADSPIRTAAEAMGMESGINVPIVREGRQVAGFSCLNRGPRRWTPDDVSLCEELAERAWVQLGRARAEAELVEREERFRTLAENIPAMCWLGDPAGNVTWMNGAAEAFFGPVGLRTQLELAVHPDDQAMAAAAWARALTDGLPLGMTVQLRGANDEYRPFRASTVPIHDAAGAVAGWCGTMVDLSERQANDRRQAALRAFHDATRDLTEARDILAAMGEVLRRYVGSAHFLYSEIGAGTAEQLDLLDPVTRDQLAGLGSARLAAAVDAYRAQPGWTAPLVINDNSLLARDPDDPHAQVSARLGVRAGILLPIVRDGALVAVVSVLDTVVRPWSSEEVALCEELAERLYAAVSRARAEAALQERERAQAFLIDWTDRLRGASTPEAIVAVTLEALGTFAGVRRATYATTDATGRIFTVENEWRDGAPSIAGSSFSLDLAAPDQQAAWLGGEPLRFDDVADDPRVAKAMRAHYAGAGIRAFLTIPLIEHGRARSALSLQHDTVRHWRESEVQVLREVAERTWIALERARTEAELHERERMQAFLIEWTDRVRGLASVEAITAATLAALGSFLGVTRATYAMGAADGEQFTICEEWRDHGPSILGERFTIDPIGPVLAGDWQAGEIIHSDDVEADAVIAPAMLAPYRESGIRAFVSVPLRENGRVKSSLSVQCDTPRAWRDGELQLLRDIAERTWVAIERARAEAELQARERNQSFLIEWTDRIREEASPERITAITLEMLGRHFGVTRTTYSHGAADGGALVNAGEWRDGVGSIAQVVFRMDQVGEDVAREWLGGGVIRYDDIERDPRIPPARRDFFRQSEVRSLLTIPLVESGRVQSALSLQSKALRPWTAGEVALMREVAERAWVVLERARAEAELQARERHQAFVISWSDEIRGQTRPDAILATTLAWLGEHLGASRTTYAEAAGDEFEVVEEWYDGVGSLRGNRFSLASVGASVDREWRSGEAVRYDDVAADPRLEPAARDRYREREIGAFVSMPLVQDGRMQSALSVQQAQARTWADSELQLIADIAERTWVALERARAQAAVAERERNQAFLVAWSDVVRGEPSARIILAKTVRMLADHIDSIRVNYAEPDPLFETLTVIEEHHDPSVPSVKGLTYRVDDFGLKLAADQRSGRTVRVEDTDHDDRFDATNRELFDAVGLRAALTLPMRRGDRVLAVLSLQHNQPRKWTDAEVELVGELADRTLSVLERAQSEARLAESEAQLAAFMQHAPVAMSLSDADGRYVRVNPECARAVDRPLEDLPGLLPREIFPPQIAEQLESLHARAMAGEVASAELSVGIDRKYGSALTIAFPIGGGQGTAKVAGFTIDLSDRKRAEAALQQSRETLYQTEKLTALGSLLAGVSHELNNPLSIVVAQAVMMERQSQGSELAERAQKIRKAADRCARIVQSFLAMARQKRPEREAVDLNAIATAAHELADYGLKNDGIATLRSFTPNLPPISADSDQLHQIVINLIVNAQQAMVEAGVVNRTLTLRSALGERPGTVVLEVADNGPGVPIEVQRRIFEPFYTTKPQGQGTGVGLSFSQGLAEAHGGTLELVPAESGACFRLTLPIDPDAADAAQAESATAAQPAPPRRALVVDDEEEIAESLADFLSLEGFASDIAVGGQAAKDRILAGDYDLIVSDLRMPDIDGPALHAFVARQRPEFLDRMAFATGDTLGQTAARFLADLKRPVLEKPFTPEAVRRFLEQMDLA